VPLLLNNSVFACLACGWDDNLHVVETMRRVGYIALFCGEGACRMLHACNVVCVCCGACRSLPHVVWQHECRCRAGSVTSRGGQDRCNLCPNGTYSEVDGASVCSHCSDIGDNLITLSDGSPSARSCVCRPGFYALVPVNRSTKNPCTACDPLTMVCPRDASGTCV
jgi:hypothetical protein